MSAARATRRTQVQNLLSCCEAERTILRLQGGGMLRHVMGLVLLLAVPTVSQAQYDFRAD